MKNCIKIKQLEVFAYHGCEEQEKINGQKFYIDANLYTDISVAGNTDDLNATVNYAEVCDFINKFLTKLNSFLTNVFKKKCRLGFQPNKNYE